MAIADRDQTHAVPFSDAAKVKRCDRGRRADGVAAAAARARSARLHRATLGALFPAFARGGPSRNRLRRRRAPDRASLAIRRSGFIGFEPFVNGMAKPWPPSRRRGSPTSVCIMATRPICSPGCRQSLARIDLLYPDPWPKRRHWKRRFVQDQQRCGDRTRAETRAATSASPATSPTTRPGRSNGCRGRPTSIGPQSGPTIGGSPGPNLPAPATRPRPARRPHALLSDFQQEERIWDERRQDNQAAKRAVLLGRHLPEPHDALGGSRRQPLEIGMGGVDPCSTVLGTVPSLAIGSLRGRP